MGSVRKFTAARLLRSAKFRSFASVGAAALAASASTAALAGSPRQPVALWRAATSGLVRVEGHSLGSYSSAELAITNQSREPVTLDVNASFLEPVDPPQPVQPLGIGLPSEHPKQTRVDVEAGATQKVRVLTVCMAQSLSSPDASTTFRLAHEEAPPPIARALRAWRRDPSIAQGTIQAAAWGDDTALKGVAPLEQTGLPSGTRRVAVVGGRVFALTGGHELAVASPNDTWRTIGRTIESVSVSSDHVYALARVSPLAPAISVEADWCVTGYDAKLDSWESSLQVCRGGELRWASSGAALVEHAGALCLHTRERVRRVGSAGDLVAPGPLEVSVLARDDFDPSVATLTRFDVRDGHERETKLQAPKSLEGMAFAGALYGLAGNSLVELGAGPARRLRVPGDLRPGEHTSEDWDRCLSVTRLDGAVVVETSGPTYLRRCGSAAFPFRPQPAGTTLVSDPTEDKLYAWSGSELVTYEPETGQWRPVSFRKPAVPEADDLDPETPPAEVVALRADRLFTH